MQGSEKPVVTRQVRAQRVVFVLATTLALNWLIALVKVVFGLLTHCMVIVADGLHSFSDGASNIVGLIGTSISLQPADKDHPYGHQKYETLASTVIAIFLCMLSFGIIRESVAAFFVPSHPEVNATSFIVMGITFLVNVFVVWFERRQARVLKSEILANDSWHTLSDLFVTVSVVVALAGIYFHIPYLDSIFSLVIAGIILFVAFGILKRSSDVLVDKAVLDTREIERLACRVPGVLDCHEIRTRGRLEDIYVDLHILVDPKMTVEASHRLANIIEHDIRKEIPGIRDVVVHVEPVSHGHQELEDIEPSR